MLRQIPERAFGNYSMSLQFLNIQKCGIREIHEGAFYGLASLKKLSLSNNDIAAVKEEWFRDTVYLEQLDLSYNKITILQPIIFSKILLLKRLDLRENRLTCFDYNSLPGGIAKVYFSGNPLSFLCRGKVRTWNTLVKNPGLYDSTRIVALPWTGTLTLRLDCESLGSQIFIVYFI